jgi:hypothetical protein
LPKLFLEKPMHVKLADMELLGEGVEIDVGIYVFVDVVDEIIGDFSLFFYRIFLHGMYCSNIYYYFEQK